MDFKALFSQDHYALAPQILLTTEGVKSNWAIEIKDGTIKNIGPKTTIENAVELKGHALIPGFVDAHTHVGQIFGKALIGGEPAQIWRRIWHPMERDMTEEQCYITAKWAFWEALRGGFTKVVNYGLNNLVKNAGVHRAAVETGIRLVSACGLDEFAESSGTGTGKHSFEDICAVIEAHIADCAQYPLIEPSVCCSSFIGNAPETLAALSQLCKDHGIILQIHSNEHFPEVHECITQFGMRPIELLDKYGVLGPHVLLHHTTLVAEPEIEMIAKSNTATSYNPLASTWKGNAVAPAHRFAQRNIRFGIGSDTTSACAFKNLTAAEACQRIAHGLPVADFSCGAAYIWVDAATTQGAKATGGDHVHGPLTKGLAADFLILDMMVPECLPSHDFEWELVRYYNRDQVKAAIINGSARMIDGKPNGWSVDGFLQTSMPIADAITSNEEIVRCHGPSSNYRP